MNVSMEGGRRLPAAPSLRKIDALPTAPAAPARASAADHGWTTGVEALAAHRQAALGGFHIGAPPSR